VLVGIFGVAEEGKKLLGSHGPHSWLSYSRAIVIIGFIRVSVGLGGQFNGPAAHFDRSAVILA